MPFIKCIRGDITRSDADILVNTVNCVGVMGAGVAKAFANTFPGIVQPYRSACHQGQILPGSCKLYPLSEPVPTGRQRAWAAMATKDHWRSPSQYIWVEQALAELAANARNLGFTSIAIPRPGCGHGGLDWAKVQPMLEAALREFDVTVYL